MIELWDGYAITADEYQFILGKPVMRTHKARDKEELHIDNATYHATLAQALASFHRYADEGIYQEQSTDACAGHRGVSADRKSYPYAGPGSKLYRKYNLVRSAA